MIAEYRHKAGTSISIMFCCILTTVLIAYVFEFFKCNFQFGYLSIPMNCIIAITYLYALWNLAKARGYSGYVGILLSVFFLLGIIILFALEDKTAIHKAINDYSPTEADENRCPRCDTNYSQNIKTCPDCQIELV